jgi:hypothetical protein
MARVKTIALLLYPRILNRLFNRLLAFLFFTLVQRKYLGLLTFRATDIAKEKKRTKVTGDDVITALNELGFNKFEDALKDFIKNYNSEKEDLARDNRDRKRVRDGE